MKFALLPFVVFLLTSCGPRDGKPEEADSQLAYLLSVYDETAKTGIPEYAVVDRIASRLQSSPEPFNMVLFLTNHIQRFPRDPHNGSYLIHVGDYYLGEGSSEIAHDYYVRSIDRYPELIQDEENSHVAALNRLLRTTEDPGERISVLQTLLQRYSSFIDPGRTYYYLAREYERSGLWPEAYDSYEHFLDYPGTEIPGVPEAYATIAGKVEFYHSSRNWTYNELDTLVQLIKNAIWTQDTSAIIDYRSQNNFFTMSWEQELNDENSQIPSFDIGFFLRHSRVRFSEDLDLASNAREAYLRTWGWSHRIPTWYLYFRRVDFPADPEINGSWEWAGIYFGEAL